MSLPLPFPTSAQPPLRSPRALSQSSSSAAASARHHGLGGHLLSANDSVADGGSIIDGKCVMGPRLTAAEDDDMEKSHQKILDGLAERLKRYIGVTGMLKLDFQLLLKEV